MTWQVWKHEPSVATVGRDKIQYLTIWKLAMWWIFARLCEHIVAPPPHPSEASPQPNIYGARPENVVANPKKSARILRSSGIWHFFKICNILLLSAPNLLAKWIDLLCPDTHTQIFTAPGWKMSRHFAWHFGGFRSGILQIGKSAKFLRSSGIWNFFQICNIPLLSALNWHANWFNLFYPGICTQILTTAVGKCQETLHANSDHLEVEYCKSEQTVRILRSSGI
jgi:hypothetical protein